jgi:hypothetical protein
VSVTGGNAIRGSTMTFYRPTQTPGTGGQTTISWVETLASVKLELHTLTDEVVRRVWGADTPVELVTFAGSNADIRPQDGVVVTAGTYSGTRYRVTKTKRSRKYLEVALNSTEEAIPDE